MVSWKAVIIQDTKDPWCCPVTEQFLLHTWTKSEHIHMNGYPMNRAMEIAGIALTVALLARACQALVSSVTRLGARGRRVPHEL